MCDEVITFLKVEPGKTYLDCTVGGGGHSEAILEKSSPGGFLFGLERDQSALVQADERLRERFRGRYRFYHSDFKDVSQVIDSEKKGTIHGILADLGVSTMQLGNPERGFSFQQSGPLDMRMDQSQGLQASDLVATLSERDLTALIHDFGEERYAGRIARAIVREREKNRIESTGALSELIKNAVPSHYRYGRIHPATRTFQALRIAVNRELESLSEFILEIFQYLVIGGRLAIISFHSLEDRIVKHTFLQLVQKRKKDPLFQWTKRPVLPGDPEIRINPASRSAKMRVIERRS
jgi:16S rRNA (cytosine1402-N4)-methyltransferase